MAKIAWLVQNPDTTPDGHTDKRNAIASRLMAAANQQGLELIWKNVRNILADLDRVRNGLEQPPLFATFWCKDTMVQRAVEACDIPTFNSADAIDACDDKMRTYFVLEKANLPQPKTLPVPRTWGAAEWQEEPFVDYVIKTMDLPIVGKECFGSFGNEVSLLRDRDQLVCWLEDRSAAGKDCLVQEFISESAGRDLRLYIVGNKVAAAMERRSGTDDFRANISNGGSGIAYSPSKEEEALAIAAAKTCRCVWAGVDLLITSKGPVVCEVNSNAHFMGLEEATGCDIAGSIIEAALNAIR